MRKSLIIYLLLLPLLSASAIGSAAALRDTGSISPWSNSLATTSQIIDEDNGISVGNLFTAAPRFDSVASSLVPILGLAQCTGKDPDRFLQPPRFLINQTFLI